MGVNVFSGCIMSVCVCDVCGWGAIKGQRESECNLSRKEERMKIFIWADETVQLCELQTEMASHRTSSSARHKSAK